jgi:hypothetical protein
MRALAILAAHQNVDFVAGRTVAILWRLRQRIGLAESQV